MEPTQYPFNHLLAPIKLRGLTLPNRVMMSGLHLGLEEQPNREAVMAHFLRQRAAGEGGLVMVGGCSPNQEGRSRLNLRLSLAGETEVDKHLAYTEAVHQEGGRIALQICHFGREAFHGKNVSSSSLRAPGVLYRPRALEETERYGTPYVGHLDLAYEVGQRLSIELDADKDMVAVGTYLMDIKLGQAKAEGKIEEHIGMSAKATTEFLKQFGIVEDIRQNIVNCVEAHHATIPYQSLEAEICANADCYRFLHPRGLFGYFILHGSLFRVTYPYKE